MEKEKDIERILGGSYTILYEEIQYGLVSKNNVKRIAMKMNRRVHGEFMKEPHRDLGDTYLAMLDMWYSVELCDHENDGKIMFMKILEQFPELNDVVKKMKSEDSGKTDLKCKEGIMDKQVAPKSVGNNSKGK